MAACQTLGKSAIVYVEFRENCLATGVEVEKRVLTGHEILKEISGMLRKWARGWYIVTGNISSELIISQSLVKLGKQMKQRRG